MSGCEKKEEAAAPAEATPTPTPPVKYTAVFQPKSEKKIIPNARGKIIKCPYEIGDNVSKGDLLYEIEDSGIADNIATTKNAVKKADISISTARDSNDDLTVTAPASGILHNFSVKKGERISAVTIGEIVDEKEIVAKVPFTKEQKSQISVGMSGYITSAEYMSSTPARVTRIYDAQTDSVGGAALYYVELTAGNQGGFNGGDTVGAVVETGGGEIISPVSGYIEKKESVSVVSKGSGNVTEVTAKEGDYVTSGQVLVRLENSTVNATLERAELDKNDLEIKLRGLEEDLADLKIHAPMSGIVTSKSKSLYDSIASTSDSVMTVTDASQLTLNIDVAEKDKDKFTEGMYVNITVESEQAEIIAGVVTAVGQTAKINGTEKLYPVTIVYDNPSNIVKPNTMATIVLE